MLIKVPQRVALVADRIHEWCYTPLYQRPPVVIRRIDLIGTAAFIFCVSYYWYTSGPWGALIGGLMFIFFWMMGLWFV